MKCSILLRCAGQWEVLVRLLIGMQRFREMEYIVDLLFENNFFELILGQVRFRY